MAESEGHSWGRLGRAVLSATADQGEKKAAPSKGPTSKKPEHHPVTGSVGRTPSKDSAVKRALKRNREAGKRRRAGARST